MPLFSDHINNMYYSGSPSYSASPYSSYSAPIGSSYSASYLNPGGNYSKHSSLAGYSRAPLPSRWNSGTGRNYSPLLTTISERNTSSPLRIHSPRRIPLSQRSYGTPSYTPKPIHINTADIDVSRDKYRDRSSIPTTYTPAYPHVSATAVEQSGPPASEYATVDTENPFMPRVDGKSETDMDSAPSLQRSTIRRGRTVVRLHTIKRKERDSPRKAENTSEETVLQPMEDSLIDCDTNLGWREKLSDDLVYKDKREKKTLGAKLVEKFIVKDKNDDDSVDKIKRDSPKKAEEKESASVPIQNLSTNVFSKSPDRRCSMEMLAEQATLLDSLIRCENLSVATLDLSKVGVGDELNIKSENKDIDSINRRNSLQTTKSDHSLHNRISSYKDSRDKNYSKRRSLKKSSSGGSIRRLDSITEFPKESSLNSNLPAIEENRNSIKNEFKNAATQNLKRKPKISSTVEVIPPTSPLKFRVEEITVEEKPNTPTKSISYSSVIDESLELKKLKKSNDDVPENKSRLSVRRKGKDIEIDAPSPEPDDGNFWNKIGKRETVYLLKRKQNIAEELEKNRRAMFWFPEDEIEISKQQILQEENKNIGLQPIIIQPMAIEQYSLEVRVAVPMNNNEMKERPRIDTEQSHEIEKARAAMAISIIEEHISFKAEPVVLIPNEIIKKIAANDQDSLLSENENVIESKSEFDNNQTETKLISESEPKKASKIITEIMDIIPLDTDSKYRKCENKFEADSPKSTQCTDIKNNIDENFENKSKTYEKEFKLSEINSNDQIEGEISNKNKGDALAADFEKQIADEPGIKVNSETENKKCSTNADKNKDDNKATEIELKADAPDSETISRSIKLCKTTSFTDIKKIEAEVNNTIENDISIKHDVTIKEKKTSNMKPKTKSVESKVSRVKISPTTSRSNNSSAKKPKTKLKNISKLAEIQKEDPKTTAPEVDTGQNTLVREPLSIENKTEATKLVEEVLKVNVIPDKPLIKEIPEIVSKKEDNIPDKISEPVNDGEITGEHKKADAVPNKDNITAQNVKQPLLKSAIEVPVKAKKPVKDELPLKPMIATPRPLQKKAPQVIHSSSSSTSSSEEETSSEDEDADESHTSEESGTEFYECENNPDGRTSTGSNDSGFDSSAPASPAGFVHVKKGGEAAPAASSSAAHAHPPSNTDVSEQELESSTAYGIFRKTGRFTPPAKSIPRFRKYNVEDFHFIKVLGKGSFGKVLLAELRDTEYYYAVKCLKKDVVLEDDDVECTLIERKVLALGTNHPYLCHLFATFQTDSHLFFVMEYLNGGDLMFHIQQSGRFPEARSRFYAAEIVSGLKFLHKRGIVYRDLKLDNILLDYEGHVRIADFGMCKLQIFLDKTADTFCGTPDYMAPEIIKGLKYNQTVDWWSFGVLLYEMLIGQSPFSGCDEDELFWSICNEMPSYPRFLSQEALTILTRLLDKDARTRLGGTECMHGDVRDQDFFRPIHWDRLDRRELETPFKPRVRHPLDTQYFDKAFTGERPRLTTVEPQVLRSMDQAPFRGFSYTNPNATDR